MPSRLTFDPDSEYSEVLRIYCKNECKTFWESYHLPAEINRLTELVRTTIAHERRRGVFMLGSMPGVRTVTKRINELAQGSRYSSGVTGLVCIGIVTVSGVMGSHYIPQPLEYHGEERKLLEERLPGKTNQGTLI